MTNATYWAIIPHYTIPKSRGVFGATIRQVQVRATKAFAKDDPSFVIVVYKIVSRGHLKKVSAKRVDAARWGNF